MRSRRVVGQEVPRRVHVPRRAQELSARYEAVSPAGHAGGSTLNQNLLIRPASVSDAAALAEIGERTFRDTFAADNNPEDLEAYIAATYGEAKQRRELEESGAYALLAEIQGELVAFAQLKPHGERPRVYELARFYVDGRWHGQGVARELMNAVVASVRARGARTLWLGVWERNARAIRFYEKCGFRDTGSHPFLVGSDLQTDRDMELAIE